MSKLLIGLFAIVLVLVGALAARTGYPAEVASRFAEKGPQATLTDLKDLGQLQAAFNEASGSPRLILLLSPT